VHSGVLRVALIEIGESILPAGREAGPDSNDGLFGDVVVVVHIAGFAGRTEVSERFIGNSSGKEEVRIDLGRGDRQCVQAVSDKYVIPQAWYRFAHGPDPLGEPGAEEVVRHAPIGLNKIREREGQGAGPRDGPVTSEMGEW